MKVEIKERTEERPKKGKKRMVGEKRGRYGEEKSERKKGGRKIR